jgi:hypothetical protein
MTRESELKRTLSADETARVNAVSAAHARRVGDRIAKALTLAGDGEHAARRAAHQCRHCFYRVSVAIACQAFTTWKCAHCDAEAQHPNSATPRVCTDCAEAFELCTECGGDVEMRFRQRVKRVVKKSNRKQFTQKEPTP